jgi:hypothetical protein
MSKENATERAARQGGENEAKAGLEYHTKIARTMTKKTARPARKSKR